MSRKMLACAGRHCPIATIIDPAVATKILLHLHLGRRAEPLPRAQARDPTGQRRAPTSTPPDAGCRANVRASSRTSVSGMGFPMALPPPPGALRRGPPRQRLHQLGAPGKALRCLSALPMPGRCGKRPLGGRGWGSATRWGSCPKRCNQRKSESRRPPTDRRLPYRLSERQWSEATSRSSGWIDRELGCRIRLAIRRRLRNGRSTQAQGQR